jgi:hypothetical protein
MEEVYEMLNRVSFILFNVKVGYLENPFEDKVFCLWRIKMEQFLLYVELLEVGVDGKIIVIGPLLKVLLKCIDI